MSRYLLPSLFVMALAVGGSLLWVNSRTPSQTNLASVEKLANIQDTAAETGDAKAIKEMAIGNPDAKVTVIEYASNTCPHCADFHNLVYDKIKANYIDTGKVRFIVRDVYFDRFGLWAAMVARCGDGSKFFGMTDLIYSRQREWLDGGDPAVVVENLHKLGRLVGMENDKIDACLQDSEKAKNLVAAYQANVAKDKVEGTPTFFINGTKYPPMNYADFAKTLDAELAK